MLISKEDKDNYGIVYTPINLVNKILNLIPEEYYKNSKLKWLDIGSGDGVFIINVYNRLINGLKEEIKDIRERRIHIIKEMLYMVEIYPMHIKLLEDNLSIESEIYKEDINIIKEDYLLIEEDKKYDIIIGNPPYNINGNIKTPTNLKMNKKEDGKTIYVEFIKKSLKILKEKGLLNLIIPSLWLKPDKAGLYNILTNKRIIKLNCLTTDESQKEFNYNAQIPTNYFLIENEEKESNKINIYDKLEEKYIKYELGLNKPIPIHSISIINKLKVYVEMYGNLKVYKTNLISKKIKVSNIKDDKYKYKNILTCLISKTEERPNLIINYSDMESKYSSVKKVVLANKMYGLPYLDEKGEYGISGKDNYVIIESDYNIEELRRIQLFLSTKLALLIFSTTNYRMRYLEKYAFELIPDITKIKEFPNMEIDREKEIYKFINLSEKEEEYIKNANKYNKFFI